MPGLTVDTSPQAQKSSSSSKSRSASPVRPPVSPITPTLAAARLATGLSSQEAPPHGPTPRQTFTHSQAPQTAIPQPAPIPIKFDENADALALKSAISILQIQARNATRDIQTLQRIKQRAADDPERFATALKDGDINMTADPLLQPGRGVLEEDGDEDEDEDKGEPMDTADDQMQRKKIEKDTWERVPTPQNVVRCPPINWNQYSVVGESLDKLHHDQQQRPTEGMPQRLGPEGNLSYGGDGTRRQSDLGVAAPYQPGRDKIEKMGTRKGGKR